MRYLLVDAHSVIFSCPSLRQLHSRRNALARDELIKRLTHFQDASDYRVVAVFDGKGPKNSEASDPDGIQIFYSSAKNTADAIIERLAAKYGQTHQLVAVTNDLMEQQTVVTFGATAISVETFLQWEEEAQRSLTRDLHKLRRSR